MIVGFVTRGGGQCAPHRLHQRRIAAAAGRAPSRCYGRRRRRRCFWWQSRSGTRPAPLLSDPTRARPTREVNILSASVTTSGTGWRSVDSPLQMVTSLGHLLNAVTTSEGVYDVYPKVIPRPRSALCPAEQTQNRIGRRLISCDSVSARRGVGLIQQHRRDGDFGGGLASSPPWRHRQQRSCPVGPVRRESLDRAEHGVLRVAALSPGRP